MYEPPRRTTWSARCRDPLITRLPVFFTASYFLLELCGEVFVLLFCQKVRMNVISALS